MQLTRIFSFSNWSARSFVDGGIGLTIHSLSRSHSPVEGSSCWENNPFTFHTHFERRSRDDAHSMKSAISYYGTPANVAHTHTHTHIHSHLRLHRRANANVKWKRISNTQIPSMLTRGPDSDVQQQRTHVQKSKQEANATERTRRTAEREERERERDETHKFYCPIGDNNIM